MARGITQIRVDNAADALLQRGERPTIEKVRAELGTGSPNTLMRMLEVWWAELAARLAAQARADLPGIPDSVQRAMMALWSDAVVVTRREAETALAERECGLAQREAETQEQWRLAQQAGIAQQAELARALSDLRRTDAELVQERKHASALQESLAEAVRSLREAQATIEALRQASEEAQRRFRSDVDRAAAAEQRWLREVDRAREEAKAAAHDAKVVRSDLAKERQQRLKLTEQHTVEKRKFKQMLASLEKRLKTAQSKRSSSTSKKS